MMLINNSTFSWLKLPLQTRKSIYFQTLKYINVLLKKMQIFMSSKNWSEICALLQKVLVGGIWSAKTSKFSGGCAPGPPPQLTRRRSAPTRLRPSQLARSEHKLVKHHGSTIFFSYTFFQNTVLYAIQTFLQPTKVQSTGMLISKRTKLNVQRGQVQCPEGLNAMPRGAIINARGAKLNIQREQTMPRGAKLNPQRAERPNSMPRRAKLNAQMGQT